MTATEPPFPNLFIVGAPKAGSTFLERLLELHPEIFFAREKDTQFLASDLVEADGRPDGLEYRSYFADWGGEPRVGEASIYYLYSESALEQIRDRSSDPRVLVLVRNPVELVHSYHCQLVYNGQQPTPDFREAWERGRQRRRGHGPLDPRVLDYDFIGTLSPHVERWSAALGEDGVRPVLFDDLTTRTERVLSELLDFLGVDPEAEMDLRSVLGRPEAENRHKVVRSSRFRDLIRKPGPLLRRVVRALVPSQRVRVRLAELLDRVNRRYEERPELDPESRAELVRHFEPEVRRLEEIFDRDLSEWMGPVDRMEP